MDMGTSSMSSMASATTSDALSSAVSRCSAHSSMSSTSDMSSDSSMSSMSMNMYFSSSYKDYPVLFKGLSADTKGQVAGIFFLVFFVSFLSKGIEFLKNYLEQNVWKNPNYQVAQRTTVVNQCDCDDEKASGVVEENTIAGARSRQSPLIVWSRDIIRISLCFASDLLGYAMMLVVMTYIPAYFFAVILGMSLGRFFFERLSDRLNIRPGGNNFAGHH